PELAGGVRGPAQTVSDGVEPEPVAVPPPEHPAVVRRYSLNGPLDGRLLLGLGRRPTRGRTGGGQPEPFNRHLPVESPAVGRLEPAALVGQVAEQDAAE